jgi:opacity protein-like surface antigen
MAYRTALFCTAAFAFLGAASPAFAQLTGDFYVHGDVGWSGSTNANIHDRNQPVVNPPAPVTGIRGTLSNLGSAWVAGIGAGMHIFPNIRADLAYTYRGSFDLDESDQGVPTNVFKANIASNAVMATGYWDIPISTSIGAFLGFGIGWADVSMSELSSSTGGLTVNPHAVPIGVAVAPDGRTDNFAWQFAAGLAFPVGNRMFIDVFYRYFDAGHVQTPAGNVTRDGVIIGSYGGAEGALHTHEVSVSFRVPLNYLSY